MNLSWDYDWPTPPRFDITNFALGAVVSSLLVGVLGYGTLIFFAAITPREEGVNIGGAMLATLGCLVAVALGAAVTAWRARCRHGQPIPEGVSAGLVGFTLAVIAAGYLFFIVRDVPLLEIFSMLPLLVPGIGAAFAGAALGNLRREQHPTLVDHEWLEGRAVRTRGHPSIVQQKQGPTCACAALWRSLIALGF